MNKSVFRNTIAVFTLATAMIASPAMAADLPCRTAKVIVPWGAGGGTDIVFRTFVEEVNAQGAKPQLQVVNIPGQSGNKGARKFLKAKKNGCELLAIHQSLITSYLNGQAKKNWDAYQPVAMLASTAAFIGANKDVPFDDIAGLKDYVQANPNKLVAAGSLGSTSHYLMLQVEKSIDGKVKHVSYDGTRQRLTALLSGNAQLGEVNLAAARKNIESGDLKVLGVTTPERAPELPNVATLKEQGIDLTWAVQRGIALPKGTDPEIIAHYEDLFAKAAASEKVQKALADKGTQVTFKKHDAYEQQLAKDSVKWTQLAKDVGIFKG